MYICQKHIHFYERVFIRLDISGRPWVMKFLKAVLFEAGLKGILGVWVTSDLTKLQRLPHCASRTLRAHIRSLQYRENLFQMKHNVFTSFGVQWSTMCVGVCGE